MATATICSMLLPLTITFRLFFTAMAMTCCVLNTLDANRATITLPRAASINFSRFWATSCSDIVYPSISTLVESDNNASTPCSPNLAKVEISVFLILSALWLILKSPVCTITPSGVFMARPIPSTVLWLTRMNSISKGSIERLSPGCTRFRSTYLLSLNSTSLFLIICRVKSVPYTGSLICLSK